MNLTFPEFVRASDEVAEENARVGSTGGCEDDANGGNSRRAAAHFSAAPAKSLLQLVIEAGGRLASVPQRQRIQRAGETHADGAQSQVISKKQTRKRSGRAIHTSNAVDDDDDDAARDRESDHDDDDDAQEEEVLTTHTSWVPPAYLMSYFSRRRIEQFARLHGLRYSRGGQPLYGQTMESWKQYAAPSRRGNEDFISTEHEDRTAATDCDRNDHHGTRSDNDSSGREGYDHTRDRTARVNDVLVPPLLTIHDLRLPIELEQGLCRYLQQQQHRPIARNDDHRCHHVSHALAVSSAAAVSCSDVPQQRSRAMHTVRDTLQSTGQATTSAMPVVTLDQLKDAVFANSGNDGKTNSNDPARMCVDRLSPCDYNTVVEKNDKPWVGDELAQDTNDTQQPCMSALQTHMGTNDAQICPTTLRGIQSCALSNMLLGEHTLLCGPEHSGKRTAGLIAMATLLCMHAYRESRKATEKHHYEKEEKQEEHAKPSPRGLMVFTSFADLRAAALWLRGSFGAQRFDFYVFAKRNDGGAALEKLQLPLDTYTHAGVMHGLPNDTHVSSVNECLGNHAGSGTEANVFTAESGMWKRTADTPFESTSNRSDTITQNTLNPTAATLQELISLVQLPLSTTTTTTTTLTETAAVIQRTPSASDRNENCTEEMANSSKDPTEQQNVLKVAHRHRSECHRKRHRQHNSRDSRGSSASDADKSRRRHKHSHERGQRRICSDRHGSNERRRHHRSRSRSICSRDGSRDRLHRHSSHHKTHNRHRHHRRHNSPHRHKYSHASHRHYRSRSRNGSSERLRRHSRAPKRTQEYDPSNTNGATTLTVNNSEHRTDWGNKSSKSIPCIERDSCDDQSNYARRTRNNSDNADTPAATTLSCRDAPVNNNENTESCDPARDDMGLEHDQHKLSDLTEMPIPNTTTFSLNDLAPAVHNNSASLDRPANIHHDTFFASFPQQQQQETAHTCSTTVEQSAQTPIPFLLTTFTALHGALHAVGGNAACLPIDQVRLCMIAHAEHAIHAQQQTHMPASYWLSLSTAVDVDCQFIFTTDSHSGQVRAVNEFIQTTMLPDATKRFACWEQIDETVWKAFTMNIRNIAMRRSNASDQDGQYPLHASTAPKKGDTTEIDAPNKVDTTYNTAHTRAEKYKENEKNKGTHEDEKSRANVRATHRSNNTSSLTKPLQYSAPDSTKQIDNNARSESRWSAEVAESAKLEALRETISAFLMHNRTAYKFSATSRHETRQRGEQATEHTCIIVFCSCRREQQLVQTRIERDFATTTANMNHNHGSNDHTRHEYASAPIFITTRPHEFVQSYSECNRENSRGTQPSYYQNTTTIQKHLNKAGAPRTSDACDTQCPSCILITTYQQINEFVHLRSTQKHYSIGRQSTICPLTLILHYSLPRQAILHMNKVSYTHKNKTMHAGTASLTNTNNTDKHNTASLDKISGTQSTHTQRDRMSTTLSDALTLTISARMRIIIDNFHCGQVHKELKRCGQISEEPLMCVLLVTKTRHCTWLQRWLARLQENGIQCKLHE